MQKIWHQLLICILILGIGLSWISLYTDKEAICADGSNYYHNAIEIAQSRMDFMYEDQNGKSSFIDIGYPVFLSILFRIFGQSIKIAQIANLFLWVFVSLLAYRIFLMIESPKVANFLVLPFTLSPMMNSSAGRLYSEHLAVFGEMLILSVMIQSVIRRTWVHLNAVDYVQLFIGIVILGTTKSAYYPLFILLSFVFIFKKYYYYALIFVFASVAIFPSHSAVQKGGRGMLNLSVQSIKVDTQTYSEVFKCGVYNFSLNVGMMIFPNQEGECRAMDFSSDKVDLSRNYWKQGFAEYEAGNSFNNSFRRILGNPIKYFLVGLATVPTAFLIDGLNPVVFSKNPILKKGSWILLKLLWSLCLWGCLLNLLLAFCKGNLDFIMNKIVKTLLFPLCYIILFHMNVHSEQKHYFTLLPILYLSFGFNISMLMQTNGSQQPKHKHS